MANKSELSVCFHKFNSMYSDEELLIGDDDDFIEDEEEINIDLELGGQENGRTSTASIQMDGVDHEMFADTTLNSSEAMESRIWDLQTKMGRARFRVHRVMDHIITRLFSLILVITDIILVIVSLASGMGEEVFEPITLAIVSYFMLELLLRLFAWGKDFFKHWLEILDMTVVIITFCVTVIYSSIALGHQGFAKLVVVGRFIRFLLLLRLFTGKRFMTKATRQLISQNKRRYQKDGFDLDLTYITERVIAMSFPSSGKTSLYRNPIEEVSRFMNTKHPNQYKIYNLCSERAYESTWFNNSVERFLIDDHNVPRLSQLLQFCHDVKDWMQQDDANIVVVHCKGGKGRTGTCIAAWLLFAGQFKDAHKSLAYFGFRRTDKAKGSQFQGVETPSQSRYVAYLERVIKDMDGRLPTQRPLILTEIKIHGANSIGNGDGKDLKMEIIMENKVAFELNFAAPVGAQLLVNKDRHHGTVKAFFDDSFCPTLIGDVKIKFYSSSPDVPKAYDDCAFFFWFHTSFIQNHKLILPRKELDNPHKAKDFKVYGEKFDVTLRFKDPAVGQ